MPWNTIRLHLSSYATSTWCCLRRESKKWSLSPNNVHWYCRRTFRVQRTSLFYGTSSWYSVSVVPIFLSWRSAVLKVHHTCSRVCRIFFRSGGPAGLHLANVFRPSSLRKDGCCCLPCCLCFVCRCLTSRDESCSRCQAFFMFFTSLWHLCTLSMTPLILICPFFRS